MCDDPFRFDWRSVHNRTFSAGVAPLPTRLFGVVLFPLLRFLGSSLLTAFLASRGFSDRLVARLTKKRQRRALHARSVAGKSGCEAELELKLHMSGKQTAGEPLH